MAKRAKTFAGGRALSGDSSEPAQALWMKPPELPLDLGGPVDRPFNRMGVEFAGVPAITHLDAVAKRFPNNVAISDDTRQITYSDFLIRVLTLAQAIAAVAPEGRAVGLLLRHSIWHPIAMLACMAAGRPLVPLNPRDPDQRLAHIVANAQISVLIGQGDSSSTKWIDEDGLRWIDITHANELFDDAPSLEPISVDAPALVLYTSGSTGQPKGVVNSQRSLLQRVQQYADACHIDATDVFMPLSGPTTIAGTREMLTALLTGARLHMADVEALGLRGVLRQIRSEQITITYIVPALLRAVITASETGDFESLRVVRIGGEKVLWTDVALVRKVVKPSCFIQISYSSTETTGTQWFLPDDCKESDFSIPPVGYLLPGMSFAVVDDNGVPVPTGEVGELIIKSMHVLLGYWENGQVLPALPDPDDDRCRIFPTGDLVTVDAHGLMQMLGRKGRQLKINGRRVEPAELEVVVRRIPYVSDAVAIVTDSSELVIFASRGVEAKVTFTTDVRDVIRQTLPTALHPTRLHEIAELPRLAGGKIDVAKLKALDAENRRGPAPPQPPGAGEVKQAEKIVAQVWTRILGTTDVASRWDEAGGDSLKLLRCVMELEELVGQELNMESFTVDMSAADMIQIVAAGGRSQRQQAVGELLPHLVMLPGSIGYGPSLAAFGAQLSKTAHVIPIRYPDLTSALTGCGSVDHMATLALEQINAVHPRGDIRLIGYSLGGGVAFEVAARLIAEGRSVKFLGILDTNIGPRRSDYRETLSRTLQRVRSHRVTMYRMLCRAIAKCVARLHWEVKFCRILDARIWTRLAGTRFMLKLELEEILRMQEFGRWVASAKSRLPITGTLFLCNRRGSPAHLGWDSLFAKLEVIPIAGGHLDLVIDPHLTVNRPVIERAITSSCS
ncbi:acyl-CoA synthetase (AMP-forming)/AMP-acid ligase II/thioesterase domain-containing protein/acyl carrier protein [Tardiphaga robiniae]|nr:acyl-CoA synthetase (AMP-forming)/AMP-acid ligase II/thioesterase domain-containing protein/acyl carrier protein [Tardiphaga robiniae]